MTHQNPRTQLMKAWVCHGYGGPEVLALEDRPKPVPGDNEILVNIRATTVTSGDVRVRTLKLPRGFGLIGRLVLGSRLAPRLRCTFCARRSSRRGKRFWS